VNRYATAVAGFLLILANGNHAGEFRHEKFSLNPETRASLPKELALDWLQKTPKPIQRKFACVFSDKGISIGSGNEMRPYSAYRVPNAVVVDSGNERGFNVLVLIRVEPKEGGFFEFCEAYERKYITGISSTHTLGHLSKSDMPKLVRDVTRTLEALAALGVEIDEQVIKP